MKSLIQYLFEALINRPELEKNLKFEETDIEDILDILDTDEYNHFIELTGERYTKDIVRRGVFLLNNSTHFKIMYEGTLLGIFSVCLPENFKDLINTKEKNRCAIKDYNLLTKLFCPFFKAGVDGASYNIIDKNDYKEVIEIFLEKSKKSLENEKDYADRLKKYEKEIDEYWKKNDDLEEEYDKTRNFDIRHQIADIREKTRKISVDYKDAEYWKNYYTSEVKDLEKKSIKDFFTKIMSITGFVVIWQLSKDAKKKLDVNQVSLLKIFFKKLTELIKNAGAKYIMAQGKDEHVTNAYIKLGGFNSPEEVFKNYAADYNKEDRDFLDGTVIKRI